jgi:hypothetical protein
MQIGVRDRCAIGGKQSFWVAIMALIYRSV